MLLHIVFVCISLLYGCSETKVAIPAPSATVDDLGDVLSKLLSDFFPKYGMKFLKMFTSIDWPEDLDTPELLYETMKKASSGSELSIFRILHEKYPKEYMTVLSRIDTEKIARFDPDFGDFLNGALATFAGNVFPEDIYDSNAEVLYFWNLHARAMSDSNEVILKTLSMIESSQDGALAWSLFIIAEFVLETRSVSEEYKAVAARVFQMLTSFDAEKNVIPIIRKLQLVTASFENEVLKTKQEALQL